MDEERREVLERVARGELSPAEGAARLDEIDAGQPASAENDPRDWAAGWAEQARPQSPGAATERTDRATRVRVVRTIGAAEIIGDPTVSEAVADGPHVARRDGDTLVIEGQDDLGIDLPGFYFSWPGGRMRPLRPHRGRFRMGDVMPLRVRMNPDLPLEVESQAGKLRVRGVHAPIRATVQAGSTSITDFRSPLDLTVQAGSLQARGRLDHGASHVRCEAGGVRMNLERGSSVRITPHSTLGKVVFDHDEARAPWVVGSGDATLDIDTTMGTVRVTADR